VTGEAPKPARPPETIKSSLRRALYWAVYVVITAAFAGGTFLLTDVGLPYWAAILIAALVTGLAVWFLGGSAFNPDRDQDKDPFGRKFSTIVRHWLRARSLRSRKIEWREAYRQDLPAYVAEAMNKQAGNPPELFANVDGLLWAIAEIDDWDHMEPPMYSVIGFDSAGQIQALDDFFRRPKRWTVPTGSGLARKIHWIRIRRA